MIWWKVSAILAIGLLGSSCNFVSALGAKEAEIHYNAATSYEAQGNYTAASEQYGKALAIARVNDASPAGISMLTYEFGRTTGYAGHCDDAEKALLESIRLEEGLPERNSRNLAIRFFELARLMYDQKRYKDAAPYYSRGIAEVQRMNAVKADPLAFANIYDEYGNALEQSGEGGQAAEAHATANALREENPGRRAEFTPARYKCAVPRTGQSAGAG